MLLLEAVNIKKYYSERLIAELDEFRIYSGDRIGIVGVNGSGKTTLMDILSGRLEPDEGHVKRYCEVSCIRQFGEGITTVPGIMALRTTVTDGLPQVTGSVPDRRLLKEFGLEQKLEREALSGGEATRLKIADAFSGDNVLMFADEPTTNLDYKGIELLKQKLDRQESFVLISHDRNLLDSLCNRILEVRDGKVRDFVGNFSFYREQVELERDSANLEYEKYIEKKTSLEEAISNRKQRAKKMKKAPTRMGNSEARLHKRETAQRQQKLHNAANSLITRLEKLEVKEKPKEQPGIHLDFSLTDPPENKFIISVEHLSFHYGSVQVFRDASFRVSNGCKTAIWGENGTGKTTLLNLLYENNNKSIRIVPKARIGYFRQGFENLVPEQTVLWNVMRDSIQKEAVVRTILARLLFQGDAVFKKTEVLSGGEKIKVAFAKLFVSDANVLLLDEPTNYLDMKSMEALEEVLKEYEGAVLFVSHDMVFVRSVADKLLVLGDHTVKSFDSGLEEYEAQRDIQTDSAPGKSSGGIAGNLERTVLQMRLTETIAKLSAPGSDKEALEEEYRRLVELLR